MTTKFGLLVHCWDWRYAFKIQKMKKKCSKNQNGKKKSMMKATSYHNLSHFVTQNIFKLQNRETKRNNLSSEWTWAVSKRKVSLQCLLGWCTGWYVIMLITTLTKLHRDVNMSGEGFCKQREYLGHVTRIIPRAIWDMFKYFNNCNHTETASQSTQMSHTKITSAFGQDCIESFLFSSFFFNAFSFILNIVCYIETELFSCILLPRSDQETKAKEGKHVFVKNLILKDGLKIPSNWGYYWGSITHVLMVLKLSTHSYLLLTHCTPKFSL